MNLLLSSQEKIDLKRLITENDSPDNTECIRKLKHSVFLKQDLDQFALLKVEHFGSLPNDLSTISKEKLQIIQDAFENSAQIKCKFIYDMYPDIFKKMIKNELDFGIFIKVIQVLKLIEEEKTDQHEASVIVGKILKDMYIDSAVRHANHLDEVYKDDKEEAIQGKTTTWKEYKNSK